MGMFKKKSKKQAQTESAAPASPKQRPEANVKRYNETMASVLRESVAETVMDDFRTNQSFIVRHNNRSYYVGLYFDTNRIGGLSKKSSRDEDKGQLIESINGGHVVALITHELMEIEAMVLVPTRECLTAVDEYDMLRSIKWPLCYVHNDGEDIEVTGVEVTIEQCLDLVKMHGDVLSLLGDTLPGKATEEAEAEALMDGETEPEEEVLEPEPEPEPDGAGLGDEPERPDEPDSMDEDGGGSEDREGFDESEAPFGDDDLAEAFDDGDDEDDDLDDEDDGPYEPHDEEEDDPDEDHVEEVSDDMFRSNLTRRLYSDELGLEITTEAFDAAFMTPDNVPALFPTDRKDGWLAEQLNELSAAANTRLSQMHKENLLKCRTKYFALMSQYCGDIQRALDYTDETTDYGRMYVQMGDAYADNLRQLDDKVRDRRRALEAEFERGVQAASEQAALAAANEYRERNKGPFNDRLYRVDSECKEDLQDEFQNGVRSMNEARREEARKRMDLGVNEALKLVTDLYMEMRDAERAEYLRFEEEMKQFIGEQRDAEMFRVKTLSEEQKQSDKSRAVMAEYTAKMDAMKVQFEGQASMLKSQLDTQQRQHREAMSAMRLQHQTEMEALKSQLTTARNESETLRGQIVHMDETKDLQYEGRISELVGEREAFSRKYDHLVDLQKKTGAITIVATVVAVIAALAVGFASAMFLTRGSAAPVQSIELPEGYVLVQDEDGTARVVLKDSAGNDVDIDIPDASQTGGQQIPG